MNGENERKSKKCLHCGYYSAYYTKGLRRFESVKKGNCKLKDTIVNSNFGCEQWRSGNRRFYSRIKVTSRALYEILMDISAIRQIM